MDKFGNKTGGRQKGTPNKVTAEARKAFQLVWEGRVGDLTRWIQETGDGFQAIHFLQDGTQIPYIEKNPAKAADLLVRMAEFFLPKIQRVERTITDSTDEELLEEVRRRRREAEENGGKNA